jgi:hypothetical protein
MARPLPNLGTYQRQRVHRDQGQSVSQQPDLVGLQPNDRYNVDKFLSALGNNRLSFGGTRSQ